MQIELTSSPKEEDAKRISQGIVEFNHTEIPDLESEKAEIRFFVFARNGFGDVTGGIRARCYWNTMHVELLWLSEECRGQGTGKSLLEKAEQFAVGRGFEKAFVETTSWQAKPFYEKHGYQHVATLSDRPKGHASHYLTKALV